MSARFHAGSRARSLPWLVLPLILGQCAPEPSFDPDSDETDPTATDGTDAPVLPALTLSFTAKDFGSIEVGKASVMARLTVTSAAGTTAPLVVTLEGDTAAFAVASDLCTGAVLAGGGTCTLGLTYTPPGEGQHAATLVIAAGPITAEVGLVGAGVLPGALQASEDAHDFGRTSVGVASTPLVVRLTNTGTDPTGPIELAVPSAYELADDRCGGVELGAGGSCTVLVRFRPSVLGVQPGSLRATADPGGSALVSLGGTGTATISVTRSGAGEGRVESEPPLLLCPGVCSVEVESPNLTLRAIPAAGSSFLGWTDAPCAPLGDCVLTVDGDLDVGARFEGDQVLTVTRSGTGTGSVTSTPSGLLCGTTCMLAFRHGQQVRLVANPVAGSTFAGWSGGCTAEPCTVVMDEPRTVIARFDRITHALQTTIEGAGSVVSEPAGIQCPGICSFLFDAGTQVTLRATPQPGWSFAAWMGPCAASAAACTVTLDQARAVTARFTSPDAALSIQVTGTGRALARVTSDPTGIDCGTACEKTFSPGTSVRLSVTLQPGAELVRWTDACAAAGSGPACTVTVSAATSVGVEVRLLKRTLTVTTTGTGTGTVRSNGLAIDCGTLCTAMFDHGTAVTLTAQPGTGSAFGAWTGACAGTTGTTCTLTMDQDRSASASFPLLQRTLTITRTGAGSGTIDSAAAGIACTATTCTRTFPYGTAIALTANPSATSDFAGWTGDCTGAAATCNVVLTADRAVTGSFDLESNRLDVTRNGPGTVMSNPGTIQCGSVCSQSYPGNTSVTLAATAGSGGTFKGWSGDCTGSDATCVLAMDQPRGVTALFHHLVTVSTSGQGTVRTNPGGHACSASCTYDYAGGTIVTLTAEPASGWVFASWAGCASGTATCSLTVDAAKSVTATFTQGPKTLTVSRSPAGSGGGTVSGNGIDCGSTCTASFAHGTVVALTAQADAESDFSGWAGDCTGTAACQVTMSADRSVRADFVLEQNLLQVTRSGSGTGRVTSESPPGVGIDCGLSCQATLPGNVSVTLRAAASTGSTFASWGGACAGTSGPTCTVAMSSPRDVTATFTASPQRLTVTTVGSGQVTSQPTGIVCGSTPGATDCTEDYGFGQMVTLTAQPASNWTFGRWTGACAGLTETCTVTMDQARTVTARFVDTAEFPTVEVRVTGAGVVIFPGSGFRCTGLCSAGWFAGTMLTFTAEPGPGKTFLGWTGPCTGTALTCTFKLIERTNLSASFTP